MEKQIRFFDAIVTLGVLAALSISAYALFRGRDTASATWEFKFVTAVMNGSDDKVSISEDGGPDVEGTKILLPKLAELGRQGWELVSTNLYINERANGGVEYFSFKRRK